MKEWNPSQEDLLKVERLIISHQLDYDYLMEEMKGKEVELSRIKNQIRTGGKMDNDIYRGLCNKQDEIKDEINNLRPQINELKDKLRRKQLMKAEIRNHIDGNLSMSEDVEVKIRDLRNFYNKFASDATRVSSTRIMASKFVEELQDILKIMKTAKISTND